MSKAKENPEPQKNRSKSEKKEKKSNGGVVLRALRRAKTIYGMDIRPNTKIFVSEDLTYHVPIVYCYGDVGTLNDLKGVLFKNSPPKSGIAKGYEVFGTASDAVGNLNMCLVWVNNEDPLMETMPGIVHEIVHASQEILKHACVEDSSGEAQAYLVERECCKVFREMYGMDIESRSTVEHVKKVLKVSDGKKPESDDTANGGVDRQGSGQEKG